METFDLKRINGFSQSLVNRLSRRDGSGREGFYSNEESKFAHNFVRPRTSKEAFSKAEGGNVNAEVGNSKEEGGRWKAEAQKAYGRRIAHLNFSAIRIKWVGS